MESKIGKVKIRKISTQSYGKRKTFYLKQGKVGYSGEGYIPSYQRLSFMQELLRYLWVNNI